MLALQFNLKVPIGYRTSFFATGVITVNNFFTITVGAINYSKILKCDILIQFYAFMHNILH